MKKTIPSLKKSFQQNFLFSIIFLCCSSTVASQQIAVARLLCENKVDPVGVGTLSPSFSWVLSSNKRYILQSAYQLQVSDNGDFKKDKKIWDSGKVVADRSVHLPYKGPELTSNSKYYWRVRVWDQKGNGSQWSDVATWQMGLMDPTDWKAKWIGVSVEKDTVNHPSPFFRKGFSLPKKIASATAHITSHGLYEAYINGKRIGDAYFTPGWTSYNKRLQYQSYDVTALLQQGENAVGAILGSGWYRGTLAWENNKELYGRELALLFQIEVVYTDDSKEIITTDGDWKTTTAEIMRSEIYDGETIDARKEKKGWSLPKYDDRDWEPVQVVPLDKKRLVATNNELIKKQETFKPIALLTTPQGDKVLDFGQNLVGFVQVSLNGKNGDQVVLDHAEVLDRDGNFYTDNLRSADQRNTYILKGGEIEVFEPHFTWQGFRYVRVKGISGEIDPQNFTAIAHYSDMEKTGSFTTSNPLLNQLQHNIEWGQKGNFLDVPTDCPQRDERLGWTGDAQVFFNTAAYNMQVDNFFAKWLKDLAADQLENGSVPHVIPNVLGNGAAGSAGWADAATIIPWNMYQAYGDKGILTDQYNSMKAWVAYMDSQSEAHLWNKGFHFGDWLFYRPDDDNDGRAALTDKYLIAQCFYANSTQILINTAHLLGKAQEVEKYTSSLKKIKEAFVKEYITPNGRLVSGSQTAYVLALHFNMMPKALRPQAAQRLADNIKSYGYHLTTGFLGTPYLCHVLTRFGFHDLAYTLLMQKTYPSWLYPVTAGATTIWERWDGQKPDGSFQTPGMNSFNHYAYGAIGDWMYRTLGGINSSMEPDGVGYKKIILTPHFINKILDGKEQDKEPPLTAVKASYMSSYGEIISEWEIKGEQITYRIKIPVNSSAELHLPNMSPKNIREGNAALDKHKDIKIMDSTDKEVVLSLGSGNYHFSLPIQ